MTQPSKPPSVLHLSHDGGVTKPIQSPKSPKSPQKPFNGHIAGTILSSLPPPPQPPPPHPPPPIPSSDGLRRLSHRSIDEPDNITLRPGTRQRSAHARSRSNPNGVPNFSRNGVQSARKRSRSIPDRMMESHRAGIPATAAGPSAVTDPTHPRTSHDRGIQRQRTKSSVRPEEIQQISPANNTDGYNVPNSWLNLSENADSGPVQNLDEGSAYAYRNLEESRARDQEYIRDRTQARKGTHEPLAAPEDPREQQEPPVEDVSRPVTHLYTLSYLIFFSFMGTLARVGLQALTEYPGAPVFPSVWFNFGGSVVMGFLAEDRMLFREEWGTPTYYRQVQKAKRDEESSGGYSSSGKPGTVDLVAAKRAHLAVKKTIPLYIGLATGFCGSFTSFSSFIRDIFLALSNDLVQPGASTTTPRNGGYSFMAALAVVIITVTASLSGLFVGAHLAIATTPIIPSLPYRFTRRFIDPIAVVLAWGSWVGAALLTALPPHNSWRGQATFSLLLAPVGTLVRFYVSLWLNGRRIAASFPLGTFVVNILGTAVLGMAWDLQRVPVGGVLGCQALQGVEDGFCGCLTTVSTWVAELAALRRRHAWTYGVASVGAGLAVMVAVMGGLRWTQGFAPLQCTA